MGGELTILHWDAAGGRSQWKLLHDFRWKKLHVDTLNYQLTRMLLYENEIPQTWVFA